MYFIYFYKQEPTHHKVGNKPHPAPRGFLSMVGPMGSNSRRIARRWIFLSFLDLIVIIPHPNLSQYIHLSWFAFSTYAQKIAHQKWICLQLRYIEGNSDMKSIYFSSR